MAFLLLLVSNSVTNANQAKKSGTDVLLDLAIRLSTTVNVIIFD